MDPKQLCACGHMIWISADRSNAATYVFGVRLPLPGAKAPNKPKTQVVKTPRKTKKTSSQFSPARDGLQGEQEMDQEENLLFVPLFVPIFPIRLLAHILGG